MHKYLVYAAFGTLTLFGTLHFLIDVVSPHVRGLRQPGPETDLYYGLHSAYGMGQAACGAMGLYLARRALPLLQDWPPLLLALLAGLGWLAICRFFICMRRACMSRRQKGGEAATEEAARFGRDGFSGH